MHEKHSRRWERRVELVEEFGQSAAAECEVSRQMLGVNREGGFIDRNERWEFSVAA